MILVDPTKTLAALRDIIDGLPDVVDTAVARTARAGIDQLHGTSRFTNRTWQLNSAFRMGFVQGVDDSSIGVLDIDPGVAGIGGGRVFSPQARAARKGAASGRRSPAEYGYFLQWGTRKIAERPFMTDAAAKVAAELPTRLQWGLWGLFNGT